MLLRILWIVLISAIGAISNSFIRKRNPGNEYITGWLFGCIAMLGGNIIRGGV